MEDDHPRRSVRKDSSEHAFIEMVFLRPKLLLKCRPQAAGILAKHDRGWNVPRPELIWHPACAKANLAKICGVRRSLFQCGMIVDDIVTGHAAYCVFPGPTSVHVLAEEYDSAISTRSFSRTTTHSP